MGTPKDRIVANAEKYHKERGLFTAFANRVVGFLKALPGTDAAVGNGDELNFSYLGRPHSLRYGFSLTEKGFQSYMTLTTPDQERADGYAINRTVLFGPDGKLPQLDHPLSLRDHAEAVFIYLMTGDFQDIK
jgi:hypothetical protein